MVHSDAGDTWSAQWLVLATGCLSSANVPDLPGLREFAGVTVHTGRWPRDPVDVVGKRVAVVGTGSSAIQAVPLIAREASEVTVFQRTATYAVPARNRPTDVADEASVKADYPAFRAANQRMSTAFGARLGGSGLSAHALTGEQRRAELERAWEVGGFALLSVFTDQILDPAANDYVADFVREKIREVVHDPATADLLCPTQLFGCKRICLESGYYEAFNLPHVGLVDVSAAPLERVSERGLVTGGREYAADVIVLATGFDAMTGSVLKVDLRGRGGRPLGDVWGAGPLNYLGLGVPGFPNLFVLTGPGSPSVLTNMFMAIEQHVEWIADALVEARHHGTSTMEAELDAAEAWVAHVNLIASYTIFPSCNSWYLGANVPGKPRVFMPLPGWPAYVERCREVAASGYPGFRLT